MRNPVDLIQILVLLCLVCGAGFVGFMIGVGASSVEHHNKLPELQKLQLDTERQAKHLTDVALILNAAKDNCEAWRTCCGVYARELSKDSRIVWGEP